MRYVVYVNVDIRDTPILFTKHYEVSATNDIDAREKGLQRARRDYPHDTARLSINRVWCAVPLAWRKAGC